MPLLRHGFKQPLQQADLPPLAARDKAAQVTDSITAHWNARSLPETQWSLWFACYHAFRENFLLAALYTFAESATFIVQPILLGIFVDWLEETHGDPELDSYRKGAGVAAGLIVASFLQAVTHHDLYGQTHITNSSIKMAQHLDSIRPRL